MSIRFWKALIQNAVHPQEGLSRRTVDRVVDALVPCDAPSLSNSLYSVDFGRSIVKEPAPLDDIIVSCGFLDPAAGKKMFARPERWHRKPNMGTFRVGLQEAPALV